mmetsp:Transcript_14296/g.38254  ORF Transcript_14296/g.38254 Transcript_14296/m.38254 type:complete len:274 (-) Transcript_14296:106-927(-)
MVVTILGTTGFHIISISFTNLRLEINLTALLTLVALSSFVFSAIPQAQSITFMHLILIVSYVYLLIDLLDVMACKFLLQANVQLIERITEKESITHGEILAFLKRELKHYQDHGHHRRQFPEHGRSAVASLKMADENEHQYNILSRIPVDEWSIDEVASFFELEGLPQCANRAVEQGITGGMLAALPVEAFQELGYPDRLTAVKTNAKLILFKRFRPSHKADDERRALLRKKTAIRMVYARMLLVVLDWGALFFNPISYFLIVVVSAIVYRSK